MVQCECNCGAVQFELGAFAPEIYTCRCSICRRFTGNTGVAVIIVANEEFRWVKGQDDIRSWKKPDADWQASFCGKCGSALPDKNDEAHMYVPAGLLPDDVKGLEIKYHFFVDSKAHWDVIGGSAKQFPERFSSK